MPITHIVRALCSVAIVTATGVVVMIGRNACAQGVAPPVPKSAGVTHATFVPNTLIPRLAMGVRRRVKDSMDAVALRDVPGGGIVERVPLFTPLYVHDERHVGAEVWLLLSIGYAGAGAGASGWILRSDVEVFSTRSGYVLDDTGVAMEFFSRASDAYAIVPGIGQKEELFPSRSALVLGRPDAARWRPVRRTDPIPFMELEFDRQSGYPSTTPSTATPYDGRLVRVGAVCGGPVDERAVGKLRGEADRNAAVDMLFVVDETLSMGPYFSGVSDFIRDVGRAAGDGVDRQPRIAVSYYTDGPEGQRTTCGPLAKATPQVVKALADSVKNHKQKRPPGDYINPPERMLDGMKDAIMKAGFREGVTSIVVVIGDTGHEPRERDGKLKLLREVADMIADRGLMVFFVHVGLEGNELTEDRRLFQLDAAAVKKRVAERNKVLADRVKYTTANADTLTAELRASRQEADRLMQQARLMADRITARNTATGPGPALVAAITAEGGTLERFDADHQQLFVPSYAWVVSPRGATVEGGPQARLRRYLFLAAEEQEALASLLEAASKDVDTGAAVDHDKAVEAFVQSLAKTTQLSAVVEAAKADWKKTGADRTAGGFLEKLIGLEIRSEALFSRRRLGTTTEAVAAKHALRALAKTVRDAADDKERFWFEAASLAP